MGTIPYPPGFLPSSTSSTSLATTLVVYDTRWRRFSLYFCQDCSKSFIASRNCHLVPIYNFKVIKGPEWCYEGTHTIKPLKDGDLCRYPSDVIVLSEKGKVLQNNIDLLDGNETVRVLRLQSIDGCMYNQS